MEGSIRILIRDRKQFPSKGLYTATSFPNLKLLQADRPVFDCPTCAYSNQLAPKCIYCLSTSDDATRAFNDSLPRPRRVSAPAKAVVLLVTTGDEFARRDSTDTAPSASGPVTPRDNVFPSGIHDEAVKVASATDIDSIPIQVQAKPSLAPEPKLAQFRPQRPVSVPTYSHGSLRKRGRIERTSEGIIVSSRTKQPRVRFVSAPPPAKQLDPITRLILAANPSLDIQSLRSTSFDLRRLDDPLYSAPPQWEKANSIRRRSTGTRSIDMPLNFTGCSMSGEIEMGIRLAAMCPNEHRLKFTHTPEPPLTPRRGPIPKLLAKLRSCFRL